MKNTSVRLARLLAVALLVANAAGCATTSVLDDGSTEIVYGRPRLQHVGNALAGAVWGMAAGALFGLAAAVELSCGEPEAILYTAAVTVPTFAVVTGVLGLGIGLGRPVSVVHVEEPLQRNKSIREQLWPRKPS
jgi:hypothetical protein